jgi:hypothetical protein
LPSVISGSTTRRRSFALGRGVRVEDIVAALRFIIATPTFTGQTLVLDGGQRFLGLPRDVQFLEPGDE